VFKHLFEQPILEGLSERKKNLVRDYLKAVGCYSHDAAKLEEEDSTDGVCSTRDREPALSRYERFIGVVLPPSS
jgi:hypothetical protein